MNIVYKYIVYKISIAHIFMKLNIIYIYMTSLSLLLPILYILENQVAKTPGSENFSGREHVQVAKVLVANKSGSEQV